MLTFLRSAGALLLAGTALLAAPAAAAHASGPVPPSNDPFYSYTGSTPLSQIAPGTVLKERKVNLAIGSISVPVAAEQLLYRTTNEQGQASVTVTTVIRPLLDWFGIKIVSYQTAYDALGSQCDPSYELQGGNGGAGAEEAAIAAYASAGFTVTVPDYEGTRLDWGAGQESGYGTLDAIRATEHYLGVSQHTPAGMVGYSGGSIATEWAAQLAPSYAPGLHIVGAAAGGVPADFAHNMLYINGSASWAGVTPAILVSLSRAFGVSFTPYLSAYGLQITQKISDECIGQFAAAYPGLTYQQLFKPQYHNALAIPVVARVLNHLIMGTGGTPHTSMLLVNGNADGTGDGIMIAGDVEGLAHEYCQRGVPVTFDELYGLKHTAAAVPFEAKALAFLSARFAGIGISDCALIGTGNSLAPLPVPSS